MQAVTLSCCSLYMQAVTLSCCSLYMQVVTLSVFKLEHEHSRPFNVIGFKYIAECDSDIETIVYYYEYFAAIK
jgi:hypothetical protein